MNPSDLSDAILFWKLIGVSQTIITLIIGIQAVVSFFRRPEPIENLIAALAKETNARFNEYALHRDVKDMEGRIAEDIVSIKQDIGDRLDGLHDSFALERATTQSLFRDIMRAIGQVESTSK